MNDESQRVETILNYGGGRQTIALCVLVAEGVIERPDCVVIADTGREVQSTWDYLDQHATPLLASVGLEVEVAPHDLSTVDLYSHKGSLLVPVYTETGKLRAFCSGEWKRDVVRRYLRSEGISSAENWVGYSWDEPRRWRNKKLADGPWSMRFPLVELMIDGAGCERIIRRAGLPMPRKSRCYMCPHQPNAEWRELRDQSPDEWERACRLDEEFRAEDDRGGVYLHASRVPLREADLEAEDRRPPDRQCTLGVCFV